MKTDRSIFADTYAEARRRFLEAARAAGAHLDHSRHPLARGPEGEGLFLDVAVLGRRDAPRVLAVGSGTHGIEGYSGSGVQSWWMMDGGASRIPPDTAVVFTHAHNPWGFARKARVTEDNVDLNRNFLDHAGAYPANPGYAELHPSISPETWDDESIRGVMAALDAFRAKHGEQAFSDAYNGGQYSHPDGVFYGGRTVQWSNSAFSGAFAAHAGHARKAAFIDLHTGIGPFAEHIFLCFHAPQSPAYERARAWWGERAVNRDGVTHKAVATYSGVTIDRVAELLPRAEVTAIVVEFGTRTRAEMQRAGLAGRWLRFHGARQPERARKVHADFCEAFYPSEARWRDAVLERGMDVIDRALAGIARG